MLTRHRLWRCRCLNHHDPLIPGKPVYTRSKYSSWPPVLASEKYAVAQYSLQSFTATGDKHGKLTPKAQTVAASYDVLKYTNSTKMATGIPFVGPATRPLEIKTIDLEKLDSEYELAFLTEPVSEKTRVCGTFNVTGLKATALMPNFQVMGYLWSVKAKNFWGVHKAALLTHGPLNVYDSAAGTPQALRPLTLHAACRDLKKGDSLMLGINLHNSLYKGANDSPQLSVRLDYHCGHRPQRRDCRCAVNSGFFDHNRRPASFVSLLTVPHPRVLFYSCVTPLPPQRALHLHRLSPPPVLSARPIFSLRVRLWNTAPSSPVWALPSPPPPPPAPIPPSSLVSHVSRNLC